MSNKGLLALVVVILLGITAVVVVDAREKPFGEKIADSAHEITQEIKDEIDDHTDAK
jgi:hypothetical protein